MRLIKLHIENFGKLRDFDYAFDSKTNQIFQENGWGKTTFSVFLKAMFFGMAPSRDSVKNERKKYMPWQGGNYGGFVEFESNYGKYRVTRFFGRTPEGDSLELLNLQTNKKEELDCEIGEKIFGVSKDTFEKTAFFSQLNFTSSINEQISANVLGLDKFQYDLANFNTAIDNIKKKEKDLKKEKPQNNELAELKRELKDEQTNVLNNENQLQETKDNIVNLDKEILILNNEVQIKEEELRIQEDKYNQKVELSNEYTNINEQLNKLYIEQENIKNQEQSLSKSKLFNQNFLYGGIGFLLVVGLLIILYCIKVFNTIVFGSLLAGCVVLACFIVLKLYKSKSKLGNKEKIIDLHKTNELNKKKIENLKLSAESLKKTLASYEGIALPNKDVIVDLKEKLIFTKSNLQNLKNNIERLNEDIDNGYEKIEALKEKIENFDNLQKEFEHKMDILDSTLKFLLLAKENVSQRFVQPINNAMQKLFDKFNFENKKFIIDANFNILEDSMTGVREFEYSSQGYKDLLSFCMRFYLIKEIFKKELPFIVLDDTFVNLDDNNFKSANELVQEFAEEIQIIYICANSRSKI